ncbi:MAG: hypothetical protein A2487_06340 [Candidatus Raymondbacteria bacterium RifOxyC12_full_50_8]|uniref:DUF4276 family protein n=1 Tax=Candidatus Raymondbacteria bacterium RIFOXYD12_FULL_49_13 TaxID=1817890 RepID=A0A1F7FCQ4_UNCRA|nr:MAG: hypothetical protein A2248_03240 [Candidatus Raymondbacteria bacterium RIFOXYA2_FULL_49_16]OGJ93287.1 MAG: hypothetical protein A2350_14555 [Candidatus Raymondbacteria bacterium RifOxyB12_full_50_8]OGK04247.1 MAG: hypothetical protein A2519_17965 [Candidatus Raymondbacteria bacterium RIFOXYD12_FULL_49_13]OGK06066.1 MAG: hypothetical protein A2487_06340 [Candidatus Raymondbacteria bacterium RifOxyC12_full_50_8]OGP42470.1 MAG: hypothetical protein A2324_17275 [Candidatus Raymondbacteria b
MSINVNLVVEDDIHLFVLRRVIRYSSRNFEIYRVLGKRGNSYIKQNMLAFNKAAKHFPFIILTDLDRAICAASLIDEWIAFKKDGNLLFRIAIREAEAWLLADRKNFASFLGVSDNIIDRDPEGIDNPKEYIINLAKRSSKRNIKKDIIPQGTASIGRNYNTCIGEFILNSWSVDDACRHSKSLQGLVTKIKEYSFSPSSTEK